MKVKLTCRLDGMPIGLELDDKPFQVIGEPQRARLEEGACVVIELEAAPVAPTLAPPPPPQEGNG